MAPWVATLATLVGIKHSSARRCMQKTKRGVTTAREGENHKHKFRTTENHGQSILEAKSVDFSPFWCIKEPQQRRVETALPEWLQPFTERFSTGSSCSTGVSPTDVATPPPALPPSAYPPATPTSNTSGGNRNLFTHFPKDPNCEVCRSKKLRERRAEEILTIWRDRDKDCRKIGDIITTDHEVFDEEQESRLHHKYAVVVERLATHWI